jgi:hypothetical protein
MASAATSDSSAPCSNAQRLSRSATSDEALRGRPGTRFPHRRRLGPLEPQGSASEHLDEQQA